MKRDLPDSATRLLSGTDAVVELLLEQKRRDRAAGWNTAGFVSGYRGSPLGTLDMTLWQAADELKASDIHFTPGVNEDLAATALWGSQYVGARVPGGFAGARFDGVFGVWYGKGPGVDRSGDALKHGNLAGTSVLGGALVLAGDDHAAKSSTTAHQSEQALIAAGLPVLYPADVQDIVHLGLHGLALSRISGCWVALKLVTDVVETTRSVDLQQLGPRDPKLVIGDPARASRVQDAPRAAEERLFRDKLPAVLEYLRDSGLNRIVLDAPGARRGLIAAGKSYADLREALSLIGLDDDACRASGLRLLKLDAVWPLHPQQMAAFAAGLDSVLVVEEKRGLVEDQLKAILYDLPPNAQRPRVLGKQGNDEVAGLPSWGEFDPLQIARTLVLWLGLDPAQLPRVWSPQPTAPIAARLPSFCSGCPHSTSTRVPEGSRALAGIGCHGMATIRQPGVTTTMSQMGGEGAMWIGQAPFTDERHVFANIGDGTYFHSGFLAIRAAIAAKVNITYKLLVNGFVSMTGGQPIEGELSVPRLAQELLAEGVAGIVVVTDDIAKYEGASLPGNVPVRPRGQLEVVQRELRERDGVTVLIYEQACATERRRLRKRGDLPDPAIRTFINPAVCEGCGDCGKASDCLSIEPLETPLGRKRRINQSSCNKDRTCIEGFCPSFVTVHGGTYKGAAKAALGNPAPVFDPASLPQPDIATLTAGCDIVFAGVGGTGVVTASSLLARAAQRDGLVVSTLDVTGLSQKYGAVQSHLRLAPAGGAPAAGRIAPGQGDVVIGCDLLVAGDADVLMRLKPGAAVGVVNAGVMPSADFTRNPDWQADPARVFDRIAEVCTRTQVADASAIAERELGDSIAANVLLLGMAWQNGWIPVRLDSIHDAIAAEAGAKLNRKAFDLGRRAAHDPAWASSFGQPKAQAIQLVTGQPRTLAQWTELHRNALTAYGSKALADRYAARIDAVATAEQRAGFPGDRLAIAAARGYYKLLAHKDEFEVARLLTDPAFRQQLQAQFEGPVDIHFHLGGGALARNDPASGKPVKTELRGWIVPAMKMLAALRRVRNTWADPWRRSAERKLAAEWLQRYETDLQLIEQTLAGGVEAAAHAALRELARVPEKLRGYGHVREAHAEQALAAREAALAAIAAIAAARGRIVPPLASRAA